MMLQRLFFLCCLWVGLLYGATPAFASPASAANATAGSALVDEAHIAVILPLNSKNLLAAAQAVRDGILAAAATAPTSGQASLPVQIYAVGDSDADIAASYQSAIDHHAQAVIGPLGRNPVQNMAKAVNIRIPTLTLSTMDTAQAPAGPWFCLALSAEQEARQVASIANKAGGHSALVISSDSFSQRIAASFSDEWQHLGGSVQALQVKSGVHDIKALRAALKQQPATDIIFLATDARESRQIRPFLDLKLPTYATSQVFDDRHTGLANTDLAHVRFVDMPWLVQKEQNLSYARPSKPMRADLERFYALGIDAWRVAQMLAANPGINEISLDGVSGHLTLNVGGGMQREPLVVDMGDPPQVVH